jgi:hypothetical protein
MTILNKDSVDLSYFPTFLILGPQRTGTTWLCENLRGHPQVFITEPKELYFFNLLGRPEHPRYQSSDLSWYLSFFQPSVRRFLRRCTEMLKRHGELYRPKVRGEGTASYAAMPEQRIQDIVTLNPNIKAILMVRNPIARAWSHAKKDLLNVSIINKHRRNLADVPASEMIDFFRDPYQQACGNYSQSIARWSANLKAGHLFIGFFDDISDHPDELLCDVFDFLEIDNHRKYVGALARERIAATDAPDESRDLSGQYRTVLEAMFGDEKANLERRFGRSLVR